MPKFSKKSIDQLSTCHPKLQLLFNTVILYYDCTIIEGYRNEQKQNQYYKDGKSKVKFPNGKHNQLPSIGIDVAPYIPGKDMFNTKQCYHFVGFVLGIASMLNIKIRCGADWDIDNDINDQEFNDLVHFELVSD